jgi:dUTP pyrophosphatase
MKVKVKRLSPDSVVPSYAKEGDAGLDLTATSFNTDPQGNFIYGTGLAIEIPEGYVGLIFPRSSIVKKQMALANSVGVVDSGYRGELKVIFKAALLNPISVIDFPDGSKYKVGERVAQLIIIPHPYIDLVESEELSDSQRANTGFGSSGK